MQEGERGNIMNEPGCLTLAEVLEAQSQQPSLYLITKMIYEAKHPEERS
jgi:hypothetical protein